MPAAKGLMLMALFAITGTAALKTTNLDLKISSNYRTGVASLYLVEAAAVSKGAQNQLNISLIASWHQFGLLEAC